jgi:hypothetical protein
VVTTAADVAGGPSSLAPTSSQLWRASRGPIAVLLLVLGAALLLALVAGGRPSGYLDPRAADPSGSRALAEVLRDQGVTVRLVRTTAAMRAAARPGDTVLVAVPGLLADSQVEELTGTGADLVLAAPTRPERFAAGLTVTGASDTGVRAPGCSVPAARRAGTAEAGGLTFALDPRAADEGAARGRRAVDTVELCYAADGEASLAVARATDGVTVTALGNPSVLTNDKLDEEGNAALSLGLLGQHPRLVWYLPTPGDIPAGEQRSLYDLVPHGVWWGLAQLGIAVLLLALWRARRLGPVVAEPLPVIVRAAETVEGRGRLYRRSGARDKAAAALRAASLARLTPALGLGRNAAQSGRPPKETQAAVVDAIARRSRRTPVEVMALLYGAAPADDAALVRLADELDDLEREVRRP